MTRIHKVYNRKALSLVEMVTAVAVLEIAIAGMCAYRYYSALNSKKADALDNAARTDLLLCESWRGQQGDQAYDPVVQLSNNLSIETSEFGPAIHENFNLLGKYHIIINNTDLYAALAWKQRDAELRILNIIIIWNQYNYLPDNIGNIEPIFEITTYAITESQAN
jgi:hypothetical protein